MGKKNYCIKTKTLSNLSQIDLYSKDQPLDVEARVKELSQQYPFESEDAKLQRLSNMTGYSALKPCSESNYKVRSQGLTNILRVEK